MSPASLSRAPLTRAMLRDATIEDFPVLDMADYVAGRPGARERLAETLGHACENVGFMVVINHGVDQQQIDGMFAWAARFHALPLDEKLRLAMGQNFVGYLPANAFVIKTSDLAQNRRPELNEAFFMDRDRTADDPEVLAGKLFRELNKWPDNLPGFRAAAMAYYHRMEAFSASLLPIFATALGLAPHWFDDSFIGAQATLRLTHYPASENPDPEQFGISAHTDSNFLTVLPQSAVEGLFVRPAGHDWMKAPNIPGAFVINCGDACKRWTNERFRSTEHLAINPMPDRSRYAIPFFYAPHCAVPMRHISTCIGPDNPPRYPEASYGEHRLWFMRNNYQRPAEAPMEAPMEAAR